MVWCCGLSVGFVFGGGCCFKVWMLLCGGLKLVVSLLSVSDLVSRVKWSLELDGLKRLLVSGSGWSLELCFLGVVYCGVVRVAV